MRIIALISLALLATSAGCASLPPLTIEGSIATLRDACAVLGESDLDVCAVRIEQAAKQAAGEVEDL